IRRALSRVNADGVLVEGNSFLDFVEADFAIMCARAGENKMKTSARRTLEKADAIYLSTIDNCDRARTIERFEQWRAGLTIELSVGSLPIYTRHDTSRLIQSIRESRRVSSVSSAVNF